jgi:hypothetical protein
VGCCVACGGVVGAAPLGAWVAAAGVVGAAPGGASAAGVRSSSVEVLVAAGALAATVGAAVGNVVNAVVSSGSVSVAVSEVTPHTFRKTVATLISEATTSELASRQLGHSSTQVTRDHYIAKAPVSADLSELLERLAESDPGADP